MLYENILMQNSHDFLKWWPRIFNLWFIPQIPHVPTTSQFEVSTVFCHSGVSTLRPIPEESCISSFSLALEMFFFLVFSQSFLFYFIFRLKIHLFKLSFITSITKSDWSQISLMYSEGMTLEIFCAILSSKVL